MALLNEEQSMLKDQASAWVSEQAPVASFRAMRDSGVEAAFAPATWNAMVEMGWTGILIPEAYGGSELGYLTFGVVLEQLGRQLTASPLFASALVGASAVLLGGSEAQKQALLPKVVDGTEVLTLAVDEGPRHRPDRIACTAEAAGSGFRLSGAKTFVPEGLAATTFIVAAATADGVALFLVPATAPGVDRKRLHTFDARGYANLTFDAVELEPDSRLAEGGDGAALLDAVLDRARAGLGAEMMGTASRAFEMTLEYLKTREQFGRVIGSFQALGHRAAELYTQMELARSCSEAALEALDGNREDVAQMASLSQAKVGDFLHEMSNQLIQIHGGIGMTDDFDAGFYLKRARALETLYGTAAYHRDRYAGLLGF
ncbi:MAG: acyl-CoA dehydrogenase family protein [Pseudomonadota bacterium]